MTALAPSVQAGDRVTMRLGDSAVHGTVERTDHGGLSAFVRVDGHEEHAMWFATPPWVAEGEGRPVTALATPVAGARRTPANDRGADQ